LFHLLLASVDKIPEMYDSRTTTEFAKLVVISVLFHISDMLSRDKNHKKPTYYNVEYVFYLLAQILQWLPL